MAAEQSIVRRPTAQCPALQASKVDFIKQNAPLMVMQQCMDIKTPLAAARARDLPTIVGIRKQYGDKFVVGYLKLWLDDIAEYLGASPMTDMQMTETAYILLSDNFYLNTADLNIVMGDIKRGARAITAPLNGAKFAKIFAEYRDERCEAYTNNIINSHEAIKKHGSIPEVNDIGAATLEAIHENQMLAAEQAAKAEEADLQRRYTMITHAQKALERFPGLAPKKND